MSICEIHFVNNCPLCSANAVGKIVPPAENHISTVEVPKFIPPPVEKHVFTSSDAQQIIEAAQTYAQAVETVNIISSDIQQMKENLKAAEEKLDEATKTLSDAKLKMQKLTMKTSKDE